MINMMTIVSIIFVILSIGSAHASDARSNQAAKTSAVAAFERNLTGDLGKELAKMNQCIASAAAESDLSNVRKHSKDFADRAASRYGEDSSEAAFMNLMAAGAMCASDPDLAYAIAKESVQILETQLGSDYFLLGFGKSLLGIMYMNKSDFIRAEEQLLQAKRIINKSKGGSLVSTAEVDTNLAMCALRQNKLSEAQQLCETAIKEAKNANDNNALASALAVQADAQARGGQFALAEAGLLRALRIQNSNGVANSLLSFPALVQLGNLYAKIGNYDRANKILESALLTANRLSGAQSGSVAVVQQSLAKLHCAEGKFAEASEEFTQVYEYYIAKHGKEHLEVARALLGRAYVKSMQREYAEAERLCRESIEMLQIRQDGSASDIAVASNILGDILLGQERNVEAAAEFEKALAINERLCGDRLSALTYLGDVAKSQYILGNTDNALTHLKRARPIVEDTIQSILGMDEEARLASLTKALKGDLQVCIMPDEQVAELIVQRKGIILDSLLEDYSIAAGQASPESVRKEYLELQRLKEQLSKLAFADQGAKTDSDELHQIAKRISEIQRSFAQRIASFGGVRRSSQTSIDSLRSALSGDRVLIDFLRFEDPKLPRDARACYAALVLADSADAVIVRISDATGIDRVVEGLRTAIATNNESALEENTKILSEKLWSPIASRIPANSTKLAIGPDGVLNFLSFAALQDPDGKFIVEKYDIAYVGSGRDLARSGASQKAKTLAVFADPVFDESNTKEQTRELAMRSAEADVFGTINLPPLPGTKEESEVLQAVAKASDWDMQAYLGRDATEARIRSVAKPGILHLATHGFYLNSFTASQSGERGMQVVAAQTDDEDKAAKNGVDPMRASGVALTGAQATLKSWSRKVAPDPETDGVLTAEEVAGLDLKGTWLVTLSACETGVGEARSGEGVFGLRRAFMMAGAENLLMTLWPVSDETTAKIMADFYKEVLATGDAPGSLAKVQREWLVKLRAERGMLAAVREAGPFAMVMMTNPNSKPTFTKAAVDKVTPPQSPRPNASHGNSKNAGGKSAPPKKTPRSSSSAPESVPVMIYDTKTKKLINSNVYKMQRP